MSLSESLFERAAELIPGGVNSPVRAWRAVGGNGTAVQNVWFRTQPGHYYAVINWVGDSGGGVWSWSRLGNGSAVCRAS